MQLKADTEALDGLARSMAGTADAFAGDVDALAAASHTLCASWAGQAQLAWRLRHGTIDARLRAEAAALRMAAKRVEQYADDLVKADVAGARAVLGL